MTEVSGKLFTQINGVLKVFLKKIKICKRQTLFLIILIPIILSVLPIKFTYNSIDSIKSKEFYIAVCISEGSTDSESWMIVGNQDGMWEDGVPVYFTGSNPKNILSYDICNNYTEFLIYGSLSKQNNERFYTINSDKWQIYGDVKRGNYSYRIPFKHFITLYDLKWFDFLLTDKGYD